MQALQLVAQAYSVDARVFLLHVRDGQTITKHLVRSRVLHNPDAVFIPET